VKLDTQHKSNQDISKLSRISDHTLSIARAYRRRIVNGTEVQIEEIKNNTPIHGYPWMVRLQNSPRNSDVFCGGTLISRKHIITAAHCMITCSKRTSKCKIKEACTKNEVSCSKPRMKWAILGDYDRSKKNQGEVHRMIKDSIKHPNTHQPDPPNGALEYDISIAILKRCVHFKDNIRPACLPRSATDTYEGEMATVIGWGHLSWKENNDELAGKYPDILQYINITVLSDESCKTRADNITIVNSSHLMCAGEVPYWRKDACTFDSGGK
jgi:guanylate cyclase